MSKRGFRARLRYAFDKSMAAGTIALIGWLLFVSLLIVLVGAGLVVLFGITPAGQQPLGWLEALWETLLRALDTGTVAGDQGWAFRVVMLTVTLAGLLVLSALIAVVSTGLAGRLTQFRKGRSLVLEDNHSIIFNWSETIYDVIAQLAIANENRRRPHIVIMADRDKVDMEDEIAGKLRERRNSRIVVRSGDPTDLDDIGIVSPETCRSIIILSPETENPDASVIKTILALTSDPKRREAPYRIAAEIRDAANADVARTVGGGEVQLVLVDDLVARILVQSTRQPGLSAVYTELLNFEGCEIYTADQPELEGKTFGAAQLDYEDSTLIGLCDAAGQVSLNPPVDRLISGGDKALLIAEDDDRIERRAPPDPAELPPVAPRAAAAPAPERTLLLGWNRRAPFIARELSRHVQPGSLLTVAADTAEIEREIARLDLVGETLTVELKRIDTARRAEIEALDPLSYDHVLLLGYSDSMDGQAADTRTLITLLHLRAIRDSGGQRVDVVSEIIDVRNVALAERTRIDDFVVSNKLVGLMLSQASENEHLEQIFHDLLDDEGSRVSLEPAARYVPLGQELSFYEVVRAAARHGDTAIGHHIVGSAVVVNPLKSTTASYNEGDRIIVLTRS